MGNPDKKDEVKTIENKIAQERAISEMLFRNCDTGGNYSPASSAEIINEARPFAVEFTPKKTPEELDEEINGKKEPEPGDYYDTIETAFKD